MRALRSTRVYTKHVQEMYLQATCVVCSSTAHSVNTISASTGGTCTSGASSEDGACGAYGVEAGVT